MKNETGVTATSNNYFPNADIPDRRRRSQLCDGQTAMPSDASAVTSQLPMTLNASEILGSSCSHQHNSDWSDDNECSTPTSNTASTDLSVTTRWSNVMHQPRRKKDHLAIVWLMYDSVSKRRVHTAWIFEYQSTCIVDTETVHAKMKTRTNELKSQWAQNKKRAFAPAPGGTVK